MKRLALLAVFAAHQVQAEDARVTALIQQGDACDARKDSRGALAALQQAEAIEPQNFGVLLRISKQYDDLVEVTDSDEQSKVLAEKALAYGKRAVALDAKNAKAHLNLAIAYGKLTDYVGNKTKMEYGKLILDETQRSIELDPKDDFAWHVLGRWHAGVANLNGLLKMLAGLVFGGLPPASNEEAARCLKKAAELAPQRIMHHAELAKVYQQMKQPDLAAQCWQNVLGLRALDEQDRDYQKQAKVALDASKPARGRTDGVARR